MLLVACLGRGEPLQRRAVFGGFHADVQGELGAVVLLVDLDCEGAAVWLCPGRG